MAELTNTQIDAALERGRKALLHEPRAATARYRPTVGASDRRISQRMHFRLSPKASPSFLL